MGRELVALNFASIFEATNISYETWTQTGSFELFSDDFAKECLSCRPGHSSRAYMLKPSPWSNTVTQIYNSLILGLEGRSEDRSVL